MLKQLVLHPSCSSKAKKLFWDTCLGKIQPSADDYALCHVGPCSELTSITKRLIPPCSSDKLFLVINWLSMTVDGLCLSFHVNKAFPVILTLYQQSYHIWVNTPPVEYIWNAKHSCCQPYSSSCDAHFELKTLPHSCWNSFLLWNIFKARSAHLCHLSQMTSERQKDLLKHMLPQRMHHIHHFCFLKTLTGDIFKSTCISRDCTFTQEMCQPSPSEGSWLAICIHQISNTCNSDT